MSDVGMGRAGREDGGAFRFVTVVVLIAAGVLGAIALLLGSTYAPDNRLAGFGNAGHALSNSAIGYSGIVRLAQETGHATRIVRDKGDMTSTGLLVLTPLSGETPLTDVMLARRDDATLVVLPKWLTGPKSTNPAWVDRYALTPTSDPEGVLAPDTKLKVTRYRSGGRPLRSADALTEDLGFNAPRPLQTISGPDLQPLLTDDQGHIVLAKVASRPVYVLADPDLLSNMGIRDESQAAAALAMLTWLNQKNERDFDFDVTLDGLGKPKGSMQMLFEPPFLAMTLTLVIVLILVGWQAFARFGPALRRERAIAFGKTALVDNAAGLIRKAGRQAGMGGRYVEAIRDRARIAFGVPTRLRGGAIDAYLDKLSGRARFTALARAVDDANDKTSLVTSARALHEWQKEKGK